MKRIWKRFLNWINPYYILMVVTLGVIGFMSFQLYPLNDQCNQFLHNRRQDLTTAIQREHQSIYKMKAHDIIYHYSDVTDKMTVAQNNAKALKNKLRERQTSKHKATKHKINKKDTRALKMKARLQMLVGEHNLYLLNHPNLKHYFKYRHLTRNLSEKTATLRIKHNKRSIKHIRKAIVRQADERTRDVPHQPTTNAFRPTYDNSIFHKITTQVASMILLGIIAGCFLVAALHYTHEKKERIQRVKRDRRRKREAKHLKHLYGDANPETPNSDDSIC